MATFDVAKLLNEITQDIPGINTALKALVKWDVSALTDVPDGAMQATTDTSNRLTIRKKVSGSYAPIAKLMHDVDKLDGYHASTSATANAIPVRNASGALPGNILGNAVTADTATALAAGSVVPVNQGGTGATTASQARTNLGVADGADFATHVATKASPSVEGHVKLDAFAADGSNTAAPGGFGLGMPEATQIPANTDLNTVVLPGFYSCRMTNTATTLTNCPVVVAFSMLVEYGAYGPTQTITSYNNGARFQRTKTSLTTFGQWRSLPNGISDSTSTTSSTVAASATAVKTAYDKAASALGRTGPATTTSRGIARVATLADMEPGADVENGPAVIDAKGGVITPTPTAHAVPQADASGRIHVGFIPGTFVGDIRLLPFRAADLATHCPGWLFCNGDRFANGTVTADKLNALPTNLKTDFGITNDGTNTTAPNLFYTDGRGVFLRAVNGTTRQVGNKQSDTIRNLTGVLSWGLGGWRPGSASGVFQQGAYTNQYGADYQTGPGAYNVNFDASAQVPTGSENKPLDMGMTPAIFIGS